MAHCLHRIALRIVAVSLALQTFSGAVFASDQSTTARHFAADKDLGPIADPPRSCAALGRVSLPRTIVTGARFFEAGAAMVPDDSGKEVLTADLPAFCRVAVTMRPVTGSSINMELWLPTNWNGRFLATGNGGGAGKLYLTGIFLPDNARLFDLRQIAARGFAVAHTDLGTAPGILTTLDQPVKWEDFGRRATHEMAATSKIFIKMFYGATPHHSYFEGCSTGGQQALTHAQYFPEDYDGILVSAPGNNRTHIHTSFIWNRNALFATPGSRLSQAKLDFVHEQVLKSCAGKDGGVATDPYLTDPRQCKFDPARLPLCESGNKNICLTADERVALQKLYGGTVNPRTGEQIYPGVPVGTEAMFLGPADQAKDDWPERQYYPFYWVFGREKFNPEAFDFDRDMDTVDARLAGILNANNSDLGRFERRGGKVLMYHGLMDPAVPFDVSVDYFENVVETRDGNIDAVQDYLRLFLIPGLGHCLGGPGAWDIGQDVGPSYTNLPSHDALLALIQWVENGKAPDRLIGSSYEDNDTAKPLRLQRPVCAYPNMPSYTGGDTDRADSFKCVPRARGNVTRTAKRYLN